MFRRFVPLAAPRLMRLALAIALIAGTRTLTLDAQTPPAPPPTGTAASPPLSPPQEALWQASRKGDAVAVKKLLDDGVDVNTKFRYGATALSYATDRGHLAVVRVLLERGADVNVEDTFYGATPLNWGSRPAQARKPEHVEIVRLLLKHGAKGQAGALLAAVGEGDEPMTKVILAHGPLPADVLSDALEAATEEKQAAIVATLQAAGAKPHPVATLTEAQLTRCAGTYTSGGGPPMTFALKDGKLQGGPPGQSLTLVARDETKFGVQGAPGLSLVFTIAGDTATSLTVNRNGRPTIYQRSDVK